MTHNPGASHTLTVGERGRVVIPADLRHALGLEAGSVLVAHLEPDGRLVLEDRRSLVRRLRGSWGPMPEGRSAVDELLAERRAEAALEEAKAGGDPNAIEAAHEALSRTGELQLLSAPYSSTGSPPTGGRAEDREGFSQMIPTTRPARRRASRPAKRDG
jgi:AbrB family looped-hinge helix DNA binding protein